MGLEIVGSRVANWDIRLADTIADNASSGLFALGSRDDLRERLATAFCESVGSSRHDDTCRPRGDDAQSRYLALRRGDIGAPLS